MKSPAVPGLFLLARIADAEARDPPPRDALGVRFLWTAEFREMLALNEGLTPSESEAEGPIDIEVSPPLKAE